MEGGKRKPYKCQRNTTIIDQSGTKKTCGSLMWSPYLTSWTVAQFTQIREPPPHPPPLHITTSSHLRGPGHPLSHICGGGLCLVSNTKYKIQKKTFGRGGHISGLYKGWWYMRGIFGVTDVNPLQDNIRHTSKAGCTRLRLSALIPGIGSRPWGL